MPPLKHVAIIGANGTIGRALIIALHVHMPTAQIETFSRTPAVIKDTSNHLIDYQDESSIAAAANCAPEWDLVICATGVLHTEKISPEKSLHALSRDHFHALFDANTITPALIAKYFLTRLSKTGIFAALSAKVGSISDNQLGGWYAYRASKAALNMIIKNAAIEMKRTNPKAIVVALHPGTVDSPLSKPFQTHVPKDQLFTAEFSAQKLINVLMHLSSEHSGQCLAWDGHIIQP
ncbi:MAG: SDR family NAD(P)-dependent oxidoreductase [Gammaproteobacteria bacterium]|jgi:NAD(P)-dependent dehydrogenase (short-subunit alcohol dehydrogenase family)|nr:SDR family NAD(P)-dependent oxidoreductase [Gammaproteobacteria bacterium]